LFGINVDLIRLVFNVQIVAINNFYILTFLKFFVKLFLKKTFFKNVFPSSSSEDFYYSIISSNVCQEVFLYFSKTFEPFTSLK